MWMYACACMWYVYMYVCILVFVWVHVFGCMLQCFGLVRAIRTGNRRPGPDPNSWLLWTRNTGDSKTDSWDDLKIRTSTCNEDQTTIRIRNRVISCECLLLYHFFIYCCLYYYMLPVSFHVTVWDILTALLPVSLHEISKNSYRIYLVDISYRCMLINMHA